MDSSVIACSADPDLETSHSASLSSSSQLTVGATVAAIVETPAQATMPAPDSPNRISLGQECRIFLSTFITIFLAELGDKTQLTTLLMSAESNAPWVVFSGAGLALIATSGLGVWVGHWLSQRISARTLETAAATLLLIVSVLLLWDVVKG